MCRANAALTECERTSMARTETITDQSTSNCLPPTTSSTSTASSSSSAAAAAADADC